MYNLVLQTEYPFQISLRENEDVLLSTSPVIYGWEDRNIRDLFKRENVVQQVESLISLVASANNGKVVTTPPDVQEMLEKAKNRTAKRRKNR